MPKRRESYQTYTGLYRDEEPPITKRVKGLRDCNDTFNSSEEDSDRTIKTTSREDIHDLEEESSVDEVSSVENEATELESALPPVKADQEAIASYELMRATGEGTPIDLKERLKTRNWTRGRSSIYVDAFNLALETVLEDESHLFDDAEIEVFKQWQTLDYEAQYLYVRLFLRKTSAWHRIGRLGYHGDISDLSTAVTILQTQRNLPEPMAAPTTYSSEQSSSTPPPFGRTFIFADASAVAISTLEEASSLLTLEELRTLAKDAKVQGKNKGELLKALQQMSQGQRGLGWSNLRRSDSKLDLGIQRSDSESREDSCHVSFQDQVQGEMNSAGDVPNDENRDAHFVCKILANVGPCIRLSIQALKLFERVHLVFYRSTEWTDKSLTTIILARLSKRVFPEYVVSRSTNIFPSRSMLLEFEAALRTQFLVDSILEFNGAPTSKGYEQILSILEDVYPRWKTLLESEQQKEDLTYETGEGAYLRRFSPAWVYTRIIHKACYVLGRYKMHEREWQIFSELLDQRLFHVARRGAWYQRKALLEEHYMAALRPDPYLSTPDHQKRHWRRISLNTCEKGLEDRDCHVIYHHDLQKRVGKLEKSLRFAKRAQHDFGLTTLRKAVEIRVEGIRVQIVEEVQKTSRSKDGRRSTKTVWVDEREGGGECSVECMCLSWYRNQGWRGYHAEGGIIRTLFAYLFYDVLFVYIPNVFQTPYQTCPLDLHTDAFYPSRASEINHRLVEIANGEAPRLIREVHDREYEKKTCVVGLNWGFEVEDLVDIASCFDGAALATICKVIAQEYKQRGGGIPDLFLWKHETQEVMFSEVKSENDRLSDTQRLWIHVLTGAGIRVELCHAVAREVRIKRI